MHTDPVSTHLSALILFFGGSTNGGPAIVGIPTSHIIGCQEDADIAAAIGMRYESNEIPEGWSYCGSGCFRSVYRPDGKAVVYKVQRPNGHCNQDEIEAFETLSPKLSHGMRLAQCHLWSDTVIAMEFVEDMEGWNRPNNSTALLHEFAEISGLGDVEYHQGNYGWALCPCGCGLYILVVTDFSI